MVSIFRMTCSIGRSSHVARPPLFFVSFHVDADKCVHADANSVVRRLRSQAQLNESHSIRLWAAFLFEKKPSDRAQAQVNEKLCVCMRSVVHASARVRPAVCPVRPPARLPSERHAGWLVGWLLTCVIQRPCDLVDVDPDRLLGSVSCHRPIQANGLRRKRRSANQLAGRPQSRLLNAWCTRKAATFLPK